MKKLYTLIAAFGLFVSSAVAQTIYYEAIDEKACFATTSGAGVCVEVITNAPRRVVTQYCLKEGKSTMNIPLFGYKWITCVDTLTCLGPENAPTSTGVKWAWGYPLRLWWVPVYTGQDSEIMVVNSITRIMGVPKDFKTPYFKIYQMWPSDDLAIVFKNGKYLSHYYNPKPSQKFPKGTEVVICYVP